MKFIDLQAQYRNIRHEIDAGINEVLQHAQFLNGPEIKLLERELAHFADVSHCISTASGTTALQVALMALEVSADDEVITTPFSFFATVEAIELLGAKPVFVDINPQTYNLDASQLEAAITTKTRVIMPVNLYGQCADYDVINQIAKKHNIFVVEDAAQSFGAEYKGKRSGGLATVGCTSFFPSKPLGCYGDGGACFTDDECLAEKMRMIINHGQSKRYQHDLIGLTGRLDTIQAAVLLAKLQHQFPREIAARQQVASWYQQFLTAPLKPPHIESHNSSVFAQYTIEVEDREQLRIALNEQGIPTAVHYPRALHQQPALEAVHHSQHFPHAERAAERVMSLPFHPYMQQETVEQVASVLNELVAVSA